MTEPLTEKELQDKIYSALESRWPAHLFSGNGIKLDLAALDLMGIIQSQKIAHADMVINRINTAYKYSSLEPDFTDYDAGKNRGLEIAIALLEGNESQVIEDSVEQRERNK